MRRPHLVAAFLVMIVLGAAPANAAVLFSDNFDTENGGAGALNFTGFDNFTVSNGSVDLIGNGFSDLLPGNGLYVDLDGSTEDSGILRLTDALLLQSGVVYSLKFDLAGSQRGSTELVIVRIFFNGLPTPPFLFDRDSADPFTTAIVGFAFTLFDPDYQFTFSFENLGGDNVGALLDRVRLEGPDAVPEPTSMLLFGTAAAGLLVKARRRRKRSAR